MQLYYQLRFSCEHASKRQPVEAVNASANSTIRSGQQFLCMMRYMSYDVSELASPIIKLAPLSPTIKWVSRNAMP